MLKYDLHSHSRYSKDGIMDVRDLLKIAKKRGLDGIAVTDHDTIRGGMEALKLKPEGIDVICGCDTAGAAKRLQNRFAMPRSRPFQ
jgi:predicted metal-dependent phosphoesterase TrpH